ncbi:MAG: MogA/MoaB family molybdenum cofactor biosynthesis protein [Deltaproteobacteria bacterium]|nr:MogA/MoaB family molybdenum cofactor biosynthesis protein [Deltaproteobacteria bacterium]
MTGAEKFRAGVLTMSDKGSRGERVDESGDLAFQMLKTSGFIVTKKKIVPDNIKEIQDTLIDWCDNEGLSLIVTSGGTGLSPSDVTPQAMKRVIEFEVPGIAEAMRVESLKKTPHAMISRAMAGVRGSSLIINLPGSPKGVKENLEVILPALNHALSKLSGDTSDCAS